MSLILEAKAPAKINLFLNVLGINEEAPYQDCSTILHRQHDEHLDESAHEVETFHEVNTVLLALDLADDLTVEELPGHEAPYIEFSCSDSALSNKNNLVVEAYEIFYRDVVFPPKAVKAHLTKHIPTAAGLGGGSSDAAAMLKLLNKLHDNPLSRMTLQAISAQLGADIPFFLSTTPLAQATGRGDIIHPLAAIPPVEVVLIKPKQWGISTKSAYGWLDVANEFGEMPIQPLLSVLRRSPFNLDLLLTHLYNDFETVVFQKYPELEAIQLRLEGDFGLMGVHLTGTGPTMFGFWAPHMTPENKQQSLAAMHETFPKAEWDVIVTHSSAPPAFLTI